VLIIEAGGFNTPVDTIIAGLDGLVGNQVGDVESGCRAIFGVVTRTGLTEDWA
jgi:hypothetical protein